jgi:hypothetical protein
MRVFPMVVYETPLKEHFICDGRVILDKGRRSLNPLFGPFDGYYEAMNFWRDNNIDQAFQMVRSARSKYARLRPHH